MKTTRPSNRRNFLLTAGLGGAGVAAAVATGARKAGKSASEGATASADTKYRATEHILKYYETTKV
ncbi:MAG TPA: formate dehydrogenase [Usitatibacter sp.]|nr:formate dehydrogenase [Usitatibacter sp.]